jgi:ParB family transcriptional regulator, chromosome partitioning protein
MTLPARQVALGESWAFTQHRTQGEVTDEPIVRVLPMARVRPDPDQPRKIFAPESIAELAASIREKGLLQPILVRPGPEGYRIVAGERRWRAHLHNHAVSIGAIITDLSADDVLAVQIIENLQREDMSALEEANAYQRLIDECGGDVEVAAKKLGKMSWRLTERTCLLRLEPEYQSLLASGNLRTSQAYEMAQLSTVGQRRLFAAIKAGHCADRKTLTQVAAALREKEAQASIFDKLAAPPAAPTAEEVQAASRLERKITQVAAMLAEGFDDNEIVAAKKVDPGKAATFADKLALIQKHLAQMERALRVSAAATDLFDRPAPGREPGPKPKPPAKEPAPGSNRGRAAAQPRRATPRRRANRKGA